MEPILIIAIIIVTILWINASNQAKKEKSNKHSLATIHGNINEKFFPFLKEYPYNSKQFKFLGSPIDGIQFEDDKIIFIEFKYHKSQLTKKQKHIRELVKQKKVEFKSFEVSL